MAGREYEFGIKITADGRVLIAEAGRAEKAVGNIGKTAQEVERHTGALTNSFARMGHAAATAFSVSQIAKATDAWANMNSRIMLSSDSLAGAAAAMEGVYRIAQKTGGDLAGIADVYQKISRNAVQYGLDQRAALGVTEALSNAVKLSGASQASAGAAMLQFGQALSAGSLRGEELNSILEQTPALAEAIARGMGKTTGELRKLGEEGALSAKEVLAAIQHEAARLESEVGNMAPTIEAAVGRLKNAFTKQMGEEAGGLALFAARSVDALAANLDKATHATLTLGAAYASIKLVSWGTAFAGAASAAGGIVGAVSRLNPLMVVATGAVIAGSVAYNDWAESARIATYSVAKDIETLASGIARTNAQIATMSRTAAEAAIADAKRSRAVDVSELDRLRARYERDYGGDKRQTNRDEIAQRDALRGEIMRGESALQRLDGELKSMESSLSQAGVKAVNDFYDNFGSKTTKQAAEIDKLDKAWNKAASSLAEQGNSAGLMKLMAEYEAKKKEILKVGAGGTASKSFVDAAAEQAKTYASQYEAAIKLARGIEQEADAGRKLLPVEKALDVARRTLTETQAAELEKLLAGALLIEQRNAAEAESAASAKVWGDAVRANIAPLEDQARRLEQEVFTYGLTAAAIQQAAVARLEEARALAAENGAWPEHLAYLDKEIEARRRIASAAGSLEALDANKRAQEEVTRSAQRSYEQMGQSLTDELMRGGKNAGDLLESYFRTLVFRPAIQGGVNVVMNAVGGGTAGGSWAGATNTASSALNVGSMATSFLPGGAGLVSGVSEAMLGSSFVGPSATLAGGATGIMANIGTVLPWVAAIAIAASLFSHKGGPKNAGDAVYALGAGRATLQADLGDERYGGFFTPSDANAKMAEAFAPVATSIADTIQRLTGSSARLGTVGLGFDSDPKGTAGSRISSRVTDAAGNVRYSNSIDAGRDEAQLQAEMTAEMSRVALASLAAANLPGKVGEFLRGGMDKIAGLTKAQAEALASAATGGYLTALLDSLDAAGAGFAGVADRAAELAQRLPGLQQQFGVTAEAITAALSAAISNSNSPAQAGEHFAGAVVSGIRIAMQNQQIGQVASMFAAEVINPMLATMALGADAASALSDEVINAAVAKAEAMTTAYERLLGSDAYGAAMGRLQTVLERVGAAAYVSPVKPYEIPDQEAARKEEERKAEEAARKAADIATRRREMDIQGMELSGDAIGALAAQRTLELEQLDASLRPLQERINALKDEKTAADELKRIQQSVSDTWRTIAQIGMSDYERQLDDLTVSYRAQAVEIAKLATGQTAATEALNEWSAAQQQLIDANHAVAEFGGAIGRLQSVLQLASRAADVRASLEDERGRINGETPAQQAARLGLRVDALVADAKAQWGVWSDTERLDAVGRVQALVAQRYDVEASAIKTAQDEAKQLGETWRDVGRGVREYLDNLALSANSALTDAQKLDVARRKFDTTLAAGLAGDDKAAAKATGAADAYLGLVKDGTASRLAFAHAQADVVNGLSGLAAASDTSADAQERIAEGTADLRLIQGQALGYLTLIETALGDVDQSIGAQRDQALIDAQTWRGIADSLGAGGAIAAAIRDLPGSLAALINGGTPAPSSSAGAGGVAPSGLAASLLNNYVDMASSGAMSTTAAFAAASRVASTADIADAWTRANPNNPVSASVLERWAHEAGIPGYALGGLHVGGARIVGERGPELEVTGAARYWSADQTRDMLQGNGMPAWARALIEQVALVKTAVEQLTTPLAACRT